MSGVSFMIPFVVAGGILIALSFAFGIHAYEQQGTVAAALFQIGAQSAFALFVPILAGYIAYSIADRPGLAPGMIGGLISTQVGAGFLGGIIAGFLAGYLALWLVQLRAPHGGVFVLPIPNVLTDMPLYVLSIVVGMVVTAAVVSTLKRPVAEAEPAGALAEPAAA